ncbi:MFS transporter [Streptomyces sp. NPDC088755]|uniref:MFS transporter n=1 Tax=Streptomyces sp. NPDC088755 TaxID=3365888 RepID=UPI0037FCEFCB
MHRHFRHRARPDPPAVPDRRPRRPAGSRRGDGLAGHRARPDHPLAVPDRRPRRPPGSRRGDDFAPSPARSAALSATPPSRPPPPPTRPDPPLLAARPAQGHPAATDPARTGRRHAATSTTGLSTAAETLALALGTGAFAPVLTVTGFRSSDAGHEVARPAAALTGLTAGRSLLPALLAAASPWLPYRYREDPADAPEDATRAV